MTDEEAIACGWTFAEEKCSMCGQMRTVRVPPPRPTIAPPPRPAEEYEAAKRTNEYTREQTERQKNEKV